VKQKVKETEKTKANKHKERQKTTTIKKKVSDRVTG
jgi:hypothetical protein